MVISSDSPLHILVVDHDPISCGELRTALQSQDYHVTCIDTIDVLHDFISTAFADIVLLDQRWCEQIPIIKANQHIDLRVLAITSHESESIQEALDEGADDCLTRPINADLLLRRIVNITSSQQRELAEALKSIAGVLSHSLDLEDVMSNILDQVQKIIYADSASIMMIEGNDVRILKYQSYSGYQIDLGLLEQKWSLDQTDNIQHIVQTQTPLLIRDTQTSDLWEIFNEKSAWIRSALSVPLLYRDKVVGVLNLDSSLPNYFQAKHISILTAFADYASIALQNALLYQQVQHHAEELEQQISVRTRELTKERTLLHTVIENIPDSLYVKDTEGRFILSNRASLKNLGAASLDEIADKTDFDLLPREVAMTAQASERRIIATGEPMVNKEYTYDHQTWSLITKVPLRDSDGNIIGIVGINRDITKLKTIEQALDVERTLLRTVIDNIPDNIYVKDLDHKFILANTAVLNAHGVESVSDLRHKSDLDFLPPYIAQDNIASEKQIMTSGQPYLNREYKTEDGRWLLISKSPLYDAQGNVIGLVGINRDITTIKDAEERIAHIVDAAHCLLWYANVERISERDHKWEFFVPNEKVAQDFLPLHVAPNEKYSDAIRRSIFPEDLRGMYKNNIVSLESNQEGYRHDFRCTRADGKVRWLHEEVRIKKSGQGTWRVVGVVTDITHHITLETTLQRTNQRLEERSQELVHERAQLHAIMNAMVEGVVYYDNNGDVRYINSSLGTLTGYTDTEWLKSDRSLLTQHLEINERITTNHNINEQLMTKGIWRGELLFKRKNGEVFDAHIVATVVKNADGDSVGTVFVIQDISHRKRLEKQKSRFIAHASHELRTPITNLKTRLYLIDNQPQKADIHLDVINIVTNWMHRLVDDLLDVSRFDHGRISLKMRPLTVQEILHEVIQVQQEEAVQKKIDFEVHLPPTPLRINADHMRMVQVMTNLINNAIKYTQSEGKIEVKVTSDDQYAIIKVEDTGQGIAKEILPQVFEPFFRGSEYNVDSTGLGLSIAKEIIDLHKGEITVKSEVGKGTCFRVKLALIPKPFAKTI